MLHPRRNVWLGLWFGLATGISGVFAMSALLAATIDIDATVPSNNTCFLAGTLVALADGGQRPIEDITVGDVVIAWDDQRGATTSAPVVTRFIHTADTYLIVNDELRVTPNHPLLINGAWSRADQLRRGDVLQRLDGSFDVVRSVAVAGEPGIPVFNLEVAGVHTYYADGYAVHNKGGCTPGSLSCVADACSGGTKVLHCNDGCSDSTQTAACGCGDGTLDPGEGCDDSNVSGGDGCSPSCQIENCGNGIVTPPEQCDTGINNSNTTPDACRTTCQNPSCGDGVIDTGEECDDGIENDNTTPDACRTDCKNPVCGDGVVDFGSGEQCDDGDTIYNPGDGCSSGCGAGLQITSHAVPAPSLTATTATAVWTSSIAGDSLLEWGPIQPQPTGCNYALPNSATNGTSVSSHSLSMTGLVPATVYCYRVASASGGVSHSILDTFQTPGLPNEICTDGIDNNNNGLCDYPGSTCTDGSTPGDNACSCTPSFTCTAGACVNGVENLTCTDQVGCQLPYTTQQGCTPSCTLTCGPGEQLDVSSCTCQSTGPYCGNGTCEPPTEDGFSCPQDCPVNCLPDWQCGPWGTCTNGIENRDCVDGNACGTSLGQPDNQQSCTPGCTLSCGPAEQLNVNSCTCEPIVPYCGNGACEIGESYASCPQDCVPLCTPQWVCGSWGACSNGVQSRDCSDVAACGLDISKPPTIRACGSECDAACGICQQLNTSACSCDPIAGCCGNRTCEPGETKDSCPTDCGVPPNFTVGISICQDGRDNDSDGLVDYPQDPGCRTPRDTTELNAIESLQELLDNPVVEETNTRLAAPAAIGLVALNIATSVSFADLFSLLSYFFLQPLAILRRRTRKKWGVVYNALSKQPVDLAIVRLYRKGGKEGGVLAQSRVTDREGRYDFLAEPGEYYITVTKPKFVFPSKYLHGKKRDVKYLDLYFGETVRVTEERSVITANIPVDPTDQNAKPPRRVYLEHYARKLQTAMAFVGVPLALVSFIISPGWLTGVFLVIHCVAFGLFIRLAFQRPPKSWGIVYDKKSKKPLARAVTRIYDTTYNKLLETRITDGRGRYAFLVDSNSYYVTAEHPGYVPTTTPPLDLTSKKREAIVNLDIPLFNDTGTGAAANVPPAPTDTADAHLGVPAAVQARIGVSRESLEAIRDRKIVKPTVTLVTPPVATSKRAKATLSIFGNPVTPVDPKDLPAPTTEASEKSPAPDQSKNQPGGKPSIFG